MILSTAKSNGFVVNYTPRTDEENMKGAIALQEVTYQGATVVEPERGFYTEPVVTLDFASLYPSIMMADNNSHDTWVASNKLPSGRPVKEVLEERQASEKLFQVSTSSSSSSSAAAASAAAAAVLDTTTVPTETTSSGKKEEDEDAADDEFDYDDDNDEMEIELKTPEQPVLRNYGPNGSASEGAELTDDDILISPAGDLFVKPSVRKGLLPMLLDKLLTARKRAKNEMAEAEKRGDMHMKIVYDKKQLALKVSANSVYGFCGVKFGRLPCKPIARSVTSRGREMIEVTKEVVIRRYEEKFASTYGGKAVIVYGDTDSVFVKFPCSIPHGPDGKLTDVSKAIQESFMFAQECSEAASAVFPKPHKLEVEKAYEPFLIVNKKRYAGGYFEFRPHKPPGNVPEKIATSGLETVRRDNAKMLPRQMQAVLDALMYDLSEERAIAYAQDAVAAIVHGPVEAATIASTFVDYCRTYITEVAVSVDGIAEKAQCVHDELHPIVMASYTGAEAEINATPISPHSKIDEWLESLSTALGHVGLDQYTECISDQLRRYMRFNLTPDDFVVSQKYGRPFHLYTDKQPHIEMLKRMERRGKTGNDQYAAQYRKYLGDRVDFIIAGPSAYYRDVGVTDRAEDPGWAEANGVVPDPVYYLGQILRPLARILKPLVGKKSDAYRKIMAVQALRPRPDIGFVKKRFDSSTQLRIWNSYASGVRKRHKSPVAQQQADDKKALAQYEKEVAYAQEMGMAPPTAPKRARVSGPLDSFVVASTQASEKPTHTTESIRTRRKIIGTGATPVQLQRRKERLHAKAVDEAKRLAQENGTEFVAPTAVPVVGAMDAFFASDTASSLPSVSASSETSTCMNVIIQSDPSDDIEKAIQHGVWASLPGGIDARGRQSGNMALADYYTQSDGNVWLYFTKYGSGKIYAVGRMQGLPNGPRMSYWKNSTKYGASFKVNFIHTEPMDMPDALIERRFRDTDLIPNACSAEIMRKVMQTADADTPYLKLARRQVLQ